MKWINNLLTYAADKRRSKQISECVGPAPWYYETFPNFNIESGRDYTWRFLGTEGNLAYSVGLCDENDPNNCLIVLNTYVRPIKITNNLLGVWFLDSDKNINVKCFDLDDKNHFNIKEIDAAELKISHYYSKLDIVTIMDITSYQNEGKYGKYRMNVPKEFVEVSELFFIAPCYTTEYGVYILNTNRQELSVHPQFWFNENKFDMSYQWITRITRDNFDGRVIGDGIRINKFLLTKDSCNLDRWLRSK